VRTPGIDQGELAIENGRFCGQLGEGFTHARQFVCVLGAVPRIEADAGGVLDDLKPETIPFGFVAPIIAVGRVDGSGRG